MISTMRGPYDDRDATTARWVLIFVLLSLLAHAILIVGILLITRFMPAPKFIAPVEERKMTLTMLPPPAPPRPPPKKIFVPTAVQANAEHKEQLVESENDHDLTSHAKAARNPDSIMPDVTGAEHASNLTTSPQIRAPDAPQVSSTPPTPKQATPEKPTPPTPKPQQSTQKPSDATKPPLKPTPPKPLKAQPAIDPDTGLPLLPPIVAPTMAPPNQASQPLAPAPSQQQTAASVHGAMGRAGDASPAAMATALGKYKQYVYSVVGSYWYPDINRHFGIIPVGQVHIQFTIHSDGTLSDVTILEGGNLEILKTISQQALVKPAPFKPFSEAMIREVGDSYTDDFSFGVY